MTTDSPSLGRRKLGGTGIELTELTMGTWGLCAEAYGRVFDEQRTRTLLRAMEQGIRAFDMAPLWGDDGASERLVADSVGERRNDVVYITRGGYQATEHGPLPMFEAEALRSQCEASLRRLRTDRIDVWLLHDATEAELRKDEVRSVIEALQREGKVRAVGASVTHVVDARAALDAGLDVLCLPVSLLRQEVLLDLTADLRARNVGLLARSVLLHGLLAGRWSTKKRFLADDHRTHRWSHEALAERVQQVSDLRYLVRGHVLSMASAALRFVLAHDVVSSAVIGPRTPGQVEASVQALSGEPYLPAEDLERVRREVAR